jgi:hypothetical protein
LPAPLRNTPLPRTGAPSRPAADEIGAQRHILIMLHVPERERALQHGNAIAVRTFAFGARIGSDDIESIYLEVAATHLVASEDLHTGPVWSRRAIGRDPT